MATTYPYPSEVLAERLRDEGFSVRCAWDIKAKLPGIAWLTCYIVQGSREDRRGVFFPVMVQTFMEKDHWMAWVPSDDQVTIDATVSAVIKRAMSTVEKTEAA